ncbi:restriction endonuclease [Amycolatopsis sp. NPDC049159]|uniref:nSTAND3 domain-containing NTPase n=1 Tax=Amycolatopsis sp. NPDC049159 TaxID=3157210 RepID=UPI0033F18CF2
MDSFDLGRLSDFDFEVLCRDLFEQLTGLPFEIFARGRDQGIDLRHVAEDGTLTVVQCKHWPRGNRARLIRTMVEDEREKIAALAPHRYLLATSVELTVEAKDKLVAGLAPHVAGAGDIYGVDQIVAELRQRPEIVERHFRLWLSGTAVLQALLRKESLLRSGDLLVDIEGCSRTFVQTPAFSQARRLLDERSVCIVAGAPGIGKTTIAKMLAAGYCHEGYEIVEISQDVDEINAAWRTDVPQFFYYNDFLGRSTLGDKLGKNEDNRLLRVFERVRRTPGKRVVLTTRDYLLRQAERIHGALEEADLSPLTYFVSSAYFDPGVKAEILYSLVYHSEIPEGEKRRFGESDAWYLLVYGPHFNPRIAERTLGLSGFAGVPSVRVPEQMMANFDEPELVWGRVVENELDDSCVQVLELLAVLDLHSGTYIDELEKVWIRYRRCLGFRADPQGFHRAVKVLNGSLLLIRTHLDGRSTVGLHNPSVAEYLQGRLHRGRCDVGVLICILEVPEHLAKLFYIGADVRDGLVMKKLREHERKFSAAILAEIVDPCPLGNDEHLCPSTAELGTSGLMSHVSSVLAYSMDLHSPRLAEHAVKDLASVERFRPGVAGDFMDLADLLDYVRHCPYISEDLATEFTVFVVCCARELIDEFLAGESEQQDWTELSWALKVVERYSPDDLSEGYSRARAVLKANSESDAKFSDLDSVATPQATQPEQAAPSVPAVVEQLRILLATAEGE